MRLYPAIDIRGGKCVRLRQGKFDNVTVYNDDPVSVAMEWKAQGAEYIHVVDLDGAQAGNAANLDIIGHIAESTGLPVQTGGGIRTLDDIRARLDAGAQRVIIGTVAVQNPQFVADAIARFGAEHIVVGLDGKGEKAAVRGWEEESDKSILDLAVEFDKMGVRTIVYTDISRDGMLSGPNIIYTEKLVNETGLDIIASGGVAEPCDLGRLEEIGVEGVILGKSLYEGTIVLKNEIEKYK